MNRYGLKIMTALLLMGGMLAGCIRDEAGMPCGKSKGVNLVISVAGMSNKQLTRADQTSERTDRSRIEDMNIVLADASGVIQEIIYVPNPTTGTTDPGMENNGLINGSLPVDNGTLVYHVGSTSWAGKSKIFVVCNYWQVDENGNIIEHKKNLNECLAVGTSTINDLEALKQGTPFVAGIQTSTLFGEAIKGEGTDSHGGQIYNCELKRTTAMITVAITSGFGDEKLKDGVKITPRSIQLHNVPTQCNIGIHNTIGENDISGTPDGLMQQVGWDPLTSANHGTTVGGHDNNPNIVPLFMFENRQGIMDNAGNNQIQKAPDLGKENYCSYLEVTADYLYIPQNPDENQKYISGPIKYRLYLGEDIFKDFNVWRNKHYQVTLSLKGMGGLVEDGRTNPDGSYKGDGEGASWRVVSDDVTGGGSFLTDGLNMATNGFLSYVGFVKEAGHKYGLYAPGNKGWLWAANNNGAPTSWIPDQPTEWTEIAEFKGEDCGGEEGAYYFLLYAQTWLDDVDPWENAGGITISSWIEHGYREQILKLYDFTSKKDVATLVARQWLPMPVMVDDNGNPITSGNPNDASFYYSRIDVYEGREIPWAPTEFDNTTSLNTTNFRYYTNAGFSNTRNYNPDYGFDNTVALYGTNMGAFSFQSDYGRPGTAMGVAIFRAGNAVSSSGGNTNYSFDELGRIGLPTEKEWEKIKQYGVVDMRFGFSNVPYWTSTMDGTKTKTFNPISGSVSSEDRQVKHRTRLVYHKNDFAKKK